MALLSLRERPRAVVAVLALVTGCVFAVLVGHALVESMNAYPRLYRQVVADLDGREGAIATAVTWTGADGARHTGTVRARPEHVSDTQVLIWVDAHERMAPPRVRLLEVVFGFLVSGLSSASVTWLTLSPVRMLWERWLARRAVRGWDREWREHSPVR